MNFISITYAYASSITHLYFSIHQRLQSLAHACLISHSYVKLFCSSVCHQNVCPHFPNAWASLICFWNILLVAVLPAIRSGILLTMHPFPHFVLLFSHHYETISSQKQSKAWFSALLAEIARATFSAFHVTTFSEYLMNSWADGMTMPLIVRTYVTPPAFLLPYISPNCFFPGHLII